MGQPGGRLFLDNEALIAVGTQPRERESRSTLYVFDCARIRVVEETDDQFHTSGDPS